MPTFLDAILIVVVLISAGLAMIRGFTREVFSIGSWLAAFAVTWFFYEDLLPYVQGYIEDDNIALGVTVLGTFFITLLIVSIITMRISDFVLDSRAGPLDRTLGFIFGAARGFFLVLIAFVFANSFIAPENQPDWMAHAASRDTLEDVGNELLDRLGAYDLEAWLERQRDGDAEQTPPVEPAQDAPASATAPADPIPDYAVEDQNELERQLEAPPAD